MRNNQKLLKSILVPALGYGLGFVIGVAVIKLIFDSGLLDSVANLFENQHLATGLIVLFLVVILGGALAGAIGGVSLWLALSLDNWKRPASRSAVGIGFGFGVVLMPITILLAMLAMYNAGDASPIGFVFSMGVVGMLFGFVSGVMTATLPQKGNYWRITRNVTLAFGVGGLAFGFGLWHYFYTLYQTGTGTAALLFSFFIFGAVGGMVMGWLFYRDLNTIASHTEEDDVLRGNIFYRFGNWFRSTKFYQKRGFWGTLIFFALIFLLTRLLAMSPLNFSDASLAATLPLDSIGVHWSEAWGLAETNGNNSQPSIDQSGDLLAVVWVQDDGVFVTRSSKLNDSERVWLPTQNVSQSSGTVPSNPQIAVDSLGNLHVIWEESVQGDEANSVILYRTCSSGDCGEVVELSGLAKSCGGVQNAAPSIAVNNADAVLATWESGGGNLAYMSWDSSVSTPISEGCALSGWEGKAMNPRLSSLQDGEFVLAFENNDEIFVAKSEPESGFNIVYQEAGRMPDVFVDADGTVHTVWCGLDNQIQYLAEGKNIKMNPSPSCINRPVLGQDKDGILHLLWYSDQAKQSSGEWVESDLIYESRLISNIWSTPNIVDLAVSDAQPTVSSDSNGEIHLVWDGLNHGDSILNYANFRVYECDPTKLNTQGQLALEVALSGNYRPEDDLVPYCQNQFDELLMLPKTNPAYSDKPATLNGAFDDVSALIQEARYEVLFSTMWYESDDTGTSPGHVLGQGVKALYDKVKAHPEWYPRGMTVRILLDNPPEFTLSNLISQVWNVFNHMRYAGLPTMSDPEIGWKLEIANFDGSWPHGHTKMVVIDGKTTVAAGFNYQHKHQSKDHPSGKGKDDYDLGLQMTGPVAQTTRISFDDLWSGSNSIVCPDLGSDSPLWWVSCRREVAQADHVPEVMKLYLSSKNSNAFALHRTTNFQESDQTVPTTIASAQKTLDVLQVNFTLALICDLNVLFEVCDFRDALVYMQAMMDAIETNNVQTRVLVKPGVIEGVESDIAVKAFRDALELRGLSDLVEFRYFQDSVHAKAVLIDDQFLVVGSQNFHYSAYGNGALTEFNIGTDDPDAIAAFKRFFDYHWERAVPIPIED